MARARTTLTKGSNTRPPWRVSTQGDQIVVWLNGAQPTRIGAVNRKLAADASRHGQDLVGQLVDKALWEADRQETLQLLRR